MHLTVGLLLSSVITEWAFGLFIKCYRTGEQRIVGEILWMQGLGSCELNTESCLVFATRAAMKAQAFLSGVNLLAVVVMDTALAGLIHCREDKNQYFTTWCRTEVPEIRGCPVWDSKWANTVMLLGLPNGAGAELLFLLVIVGSAGLQFNTVSEWAQECEATDLVTQFSLCILLYKNWVMFLYGRKMREILPETKLSV